LPCLFANTSCPRAALTARESRLACGGLLMRTPLTPTLLAFVLSTIAAAAAEVPWPGHGVLVLDVPKDWIVTGNPAPNNSFVLMGTPMEPANTEIKITVTLMPAGKPVRVTQLKEQLIQLVARFLEKSVEKKFVAAELQLRQGTGWYCQMTDASLVGKPPQPRNFKVSRVALAALDAQTFVVGTMGFDDPNTSEPGTMLNLLESLEFKSSSR
jgi:hypothetical protein